MTRADLHRLLDELPEASLELVAYFLQRAKEPVVAEPDVAPRDVEPPAAEERVPS